MSNNAGGSAVSNTRLLDVPPSDGYRATVNLRWVRSSAHGGTVLAQQYQSVYVGEDAVWCVIQHGLPDTSNEGCAVRHSVLERCNERQRDGRDSGGSEGAARRDDEKRRGVIYGD